MAFSLSLSLAGNFRAGEESGTIMKKSDANERNALQAIMDDVLRSFAPEFKKVVEQDDGSILPYPNLTHIHTLNHTHTHTHSHTPTLLTRTSYLLFPKQFQPSCPSQHM